MSSVFQSLVSGFVQVWKHRIWPSGSSYHTCGTCPHEQGTDGGGGPPPQSLQRGFWWTPFTETGSCCAWAWACWLRVDRVYTRFSGPIGPSGNRRGAYLQLWVPGGARLALCPWTGTSGPGYAPWWQNHRETHEFAGDIASAVGGGSWSWCSLSVTIQRTEIALLDSFCPHLIKHWRLDVLFPHCQCFDRIS